MNNPYLPVKAKIINVKPQTEIDYTFRLETAIKVASGQFFEVSIPNVGEAPISVSDFGDDWIEMTIRNVGKLTNVIHKLKPGSHLFIRGPYGNGFPIQQMSDKDLIIAVGGTGLAPVKSILSQYCKKTIHLKSLTLLTGFKSPADILFREEIEEWRKEFCVELTVDKDDTKNWTGNIGLITGLISKVSISDITNTQVITVGPPIMMKFSVIEFLNRKIAKENIWVSFERKMCCGIGKCGHCKIDNTYICLDGPVFNYYVAQNLID